MDAKLQSKIIEIANALAKEGEVWTRADLASELKQYGIDADSIDVAKIVYEAFSATSNKNLRTSFITNDGVSLLADDYRLHHHTHTEDTDSIISDVHERQQATAHTLDKLDTALAKADTITAVSSAEVSSLLEYVSDIDSFSGARDIAECAAAGKVMFEKYSALKASYEAAESDVKAVAKDFITVRTYVTDILDRHIRRLQDAFGDSVIAVAPELFDFDRIEYLDVEDMYAQTKLQYDRLSETCPVLMSEVRRDFQESFTSSINMATTGLKVATNGGGGGAFAGLALAAINMYGARIEAQQKVAACDSQLESLKQAIDLDAATIGTDYQRLLCIYKTINDIFSPTAAAFCRKSEEILSDDIKEIYRTAYSDPLVRGAADERAKLIAERTNLELHLADHIADIAHYKAEISKDESALSEKDDEYAVALSRKPQEPNIFSKIVSFGSSADEYAKNLLSWKQTDYPVVEEYQKLKTEIKLDSDGLKAATDKVIALRKEIAKLNAQIAKLDDTVRANISITREDKAKIASRLEGIVRLLKVGKQIAESKIDEQSLKAVRIEKLQDDVLPTNISANISQFCQQNGIDISINTDTVQQIADEDHITLSDADKQHIADGASSVLHATIAMMDTYIDLYKRRAAGDIQLEHYKEQVSRLQSQFADQISAIDKKAELLADVVAKINTSTDKDMLREALLCLGQTSLHISESNLDDFISGKKKITI